MASPFDALGAAAAILQFVEFGVKLSVRAVNIYTNGNGQTKEAQDVASEMKTFERMSNALIAKYDPISRASLSAEEKGIVDTARKCKVIALALLHELEELAVKGSKNVLKSLLGALKIEIRQPRIEALQRQLDGQRTLLRDRILHLVSDQTTFMAREIRKLNQISNGLATYQQQVVGALSQHSDSQLEQQLRKLQLECENVLFRQEVLASLKYKELEVIRSTSLCRLGRKGQRDILDHWKAGSGKSTLMKHVRTDNRTETALRRWANGRLLITSSHYFWYTGFRTQRTYEGLLKSILYEALCAAPGLIDKVCASRRGADFNDPNATTSPWTLFELRECIERLADPKLAMNGQELCFCFFIDGLDEYEGDDNQVVQMLHHFAQSPHIKVCASSRPWPKFRLSFAESITRGNSLVLHEHTKTDIRQVVDQGLDGHVAVQCDNKTLELLKDEIVEKAQGVFLWVTLVIAQLIRGLEYADDADTLRARLRQIPSELKDYFGVIFDRIDPHYKKQTPRLFLTCMKADEPLPVRMFDVIVNEDPGPQKLAHNTFISTVPLSISEDEVSVYRNKVSGRCHDLLEIETTTSQDMDLACRVQSPHTIRFLHKSVQDFFGSPEMLDQLNRGAGEDFDPLSTLVAAYIFLLKNVGRVSTRDYESEMPLHWARTALRHAGTMPNIDHSMLLIQELDKTMSIVVHSRDEFHWTNYLHHATNRSTASSYAESYRRDMIGQLIIQGLYEHAATFLSRRPRLIKQKLGRPYLDYALRGSINFHIEHSTAETRDLVKALLELGSNPNEVIWIYTNRTVWEMYLIAIHEVRSRPEALGVVKDIVWLLIDHGAKDVKVKMPSVDTGGISSEPRHGQYKVRDGIKTTTMAELLAASFGPSEATAMTQAVKKNSARGWGGYVKGLVGWAPSIDASHHAVHTELRYR